MKRFSIRIVYIFLLLLVVFFACKKKEKTAGGGKEKPITDSSYNLKDFVIQDASDGRILDFIDVHKIVQQNINEVANGNVVDTIYARIMVDITALKIKPRFYDLGRVTAIDPDTNEVRDLKKYDDQPYPTLKVTFNTGVARTFALVVSQAPANEDYSNLLKNQNIYFINEYKITNGTNEITYTPIRSTNHQPILQQKDPIKDTIEFKVITSTAAGNKIVFAPFKYGVDATDTVVANLNPITLEFDPAIPNDYKDYKTMTITFANGFVREYAVKVTIVDPNTALNEDVYWMKTYTLTNKDGNTIPIGSIQEHQFTHHTPTSLVLQKDTIELTLPTTQWDLYPISFMPATWNGSSTPDTITYTTDQTDNKLVFATRADTNQYKTLTVTFSNGFKREYAVKIHQIEKKSTEVSFSNFKVMDNGAPVSYIKLDTTGNTSTDGYTIINGNDSGVMIVRPLKDWHGNRQVTLQFTGLDPAVNATLAGYKGESIGNAGASLTNDGKITIDFSPINTDSVELVLQNRNEGGETRHYKIKLLSGMLKPKLIIDGTGTNRDVINFPISSAPENYDQELGIAVDNNRVYVLKLLRSNPTEAPKYSTGANVFTDFQGAAVSIYSYDITSGNNLSGSSGGTALTMPSITEDKVCAIFSVDDNLYGLALSTATSSGAYKYTLYKWTNGTGIPVVVAGPSNGNSTHVFTSVYVKSGTSDLTMYTAPIGGNLTSGASYFQLKINGATISVAAGYKNKVTGGGNAIGTMFINLDNMDRSFVASQTKLSYYKIPFTAGSTNISDPFKEFGQIPQGSGNLSNIGGNVNTIRGKDYLFTTGTHLYGGGNNANGGGEVFDFGNSLVNTLDNTASTDLLSYRKYHLTMPSTTTGVTNYRSPFYYRGGCRSYVLTNGSVRVAYLINGIGFKVWDME